MKTNKIMSAVLSLTITAGAAAAFDGNISEYSLTANAANTIRQNFKRGDVNNDNVIDIEDATRIVNHVNGVSAIDKKHFAAADVSRDGIIDTEDATRIINQINGVCAIKDNKFLIDCDNWAFTNSFINFGNTYYISEKDWNHLKSVAKHTEYERLSKNYPKKKWSGSCYGMAVTSILANYDIIKAGDYEKGADFIHEIDKPSDEIRSLINYYHIIQSTDLVYNATIKSINLDEKEKINHLIDCLKDESPTLLCSYNNELSGGHAVVAYGVEYGEYEHEGKTYDGKILVYNVNHDKYFDDGSLYFDSVKGNWSFDKSRCSEKGAKLGLITDDFNILNHYGLKGDKSDISDHEEYAFLEQALANDHSTLKAIEKNGVWTKVNNTDVNCSDEIIKIPTLEGDEDDSAVTYSFSDVKSAYILENNNVGAVDYSLSYKDSMLTARASAASKAMFAPSDSVSVSGKETDYELGIVLNDGYTVNDWYGISVSGPKADDATLRKTKDGFIFKSSDMENITVEAHNNEVSAELTFSTTYPEVLLFEKDENTIGVAVDKDNNGTFETSLLLNGDEYAATISGDANCDGKTDMADSVLIMQSLSNPSKYKLTAQGKVNADCCHVGDGVTNADTLAIQKYQLSIIKTLPEE